MKTTKKPPVKDPKLDTYEQEIENSISKERLEENKASNETIEKRSHRAKEAKKKTPISIRVSSQELESFKEKAKEN